MKQQIGRFRGVETGREYIVEMHTRTTSHQPLAGGDLSNAGGHEFMTACGQHVNAVAGDPQRFMLWDTDEMLERID